MSQAFTIKKTEGRVVVLHLIGPLDGQAESLVIESAQQAQTAGARFLIADLGAGFLKNIPIFPTLQEALDSFPN